MQTAQLTTSAFALRQHLEALQAERNLAHLEGLSSDPAYMADLLDELRSVGAAYVGAAVTEIASLRGALGGRLRG